MEFVIPFQAHFTIFTWRTAFKNVEPKKKNQLLIELHEEWCKPSKACYFDFTLYTGMKIQRMPITYFTRSYVTEPLGASH